MFWVFHSENLCITSVTSQSDCQIHLQSQVSEAHVEDYLSSIHVHPQVSSQLNKFRIYLSVARQLDYSISNEMTKVSLTSWNHYFKKKTQKKTKILTSPKILFNPFNNRMSSQFSKFVKCKLRFSQILGFVHGFHKWISLKYSFFNGLIKHGTSAVCFWHPQSVEDDFVDMRKDDPESVSAEDLHRLLVVARYTSLFHCIPSYKFRAATCLRSETVASLNEVCLCLCW